MSSTAAPADAIDRDGIVAPGGFALGRPKGLFLVAGVEFWERFSYYGMTGLLVLYLTSSPFDGGLNWDPATAVRFYGFYAGCAFAAPTLGGWISSRFLGERFCILAGGIAVACGHMLLGGPVLLPELLRVVTSVDVYGVLHASDAVLGKLFLDQQNLDLIAASLAAQGGDAANPRAGLDVVELGYYLSSWSFHAGLLLILAGTGLIKPTVSSIVSRFYPGKPVAREAGFAIFMAAIYLGALSANFAAGTLGEKVGWHYGFTATAIGMIVGVTVYLLRQRAYLSDLGMRPDRAAAEPRQKLSVAEKRRISALLIMGLGTVVYAAAFYQKGGLLNLVTKEAVDRTLEGFEIPATWFLSISTTVFVFLVPLSVRVWKRLEERGIHVSVDRKLALGLASIALGYVVIATGIGVAPEQAGARIGMGWIVVTYVFFAIGDVLIWPSQLAAVATLAPERFRSFAIGIWYLTIGFGTWLTGLIGSIAYVLDLQTALWFLCLICVLAAAVIWSLHALIGRCAAAR